MQVVYHLGAQCTDEDRLLRSLLKNKETLSRAGVIVPAPGRYRPVLRETLVRLKGQRADHETQEIILDAVMDEDRAERLIFSHDLFICVPGRVVTPEGFLAFAPRKITAISNVFPDAENEFHMALRNPATMIPALLARMKDMKYADLMGTINPMTLRWAPVIAAMLAENPGLRLTIWCNEDTPFVWPEVMRHLAGLPPDADQMEGENDLLSTLLPAPVMLQLQGRLAKARPQSSLQRREIIGEFLEKHGLEDVIEMDIALPGWTQDLIEAMTAAYEEDINLITDMNVDFIAP